MSRGPFSLRRVLSIPVFMSVPLIFLLLLARGSSRDTTMGLTPLWLCLFIWYCILTLTYTTLLYRNPRKSLFTLQLQAQGLLLVALSILFFSASYWSWLGAAMLVSGLILEGYRKAHTVDSEEGERASRAEGDEGHAGNLLVSSLVQNFSIPAFVTTLQGRIVEKNDAFKEFLEKKEVHAESLTSLQRSVMDEEGVVHGPKGTLWTIAMTPTEHAYIIHLEPFSHTSTEGELEKKVALTSPLNEHGIYRLAYASPRLAEELERVQRYRRILSVLLIAVEVVSDNRVISEEDQERGLAFFYAILKETLRDSDVAIEQSPSEVLVLLPETNREGAKIFVKRLQAIIKQETTEGKGKAAPALPPSESIYLRFGFALASGNSTTTPTQVFQTLEQFIQEGREI